MSEQPKCPEPGCCKFALENTTAIDGVVFWYCPDHCPRPRAV